MEVTMKKLFTSFLIFLVSICYLTAQPYWKNFTTSNGLPINKTFVIEADDSNRIWYGNNAGFGSDYHLVHYDKEQFVKDNISGLVYGIKAHKDTLWVVTGENIQSYNNFTNWETHDPIPSLGFINLGYSGPMVIDRAGNKWLKPDEGGLLRYNKGVWKLYEANSSQLPTDKINHIHWFDNALWLGTDMGLIKFKDNQWDIINTSNSDLPNDTVRLISDDNSRLNVITKDSKISIMLSASNFTSFSNPILKNASAMKVDGNSVMWIVTVPGITSFDGSSFRNYTSNNSNLVDNLTLSVTVDKNDHKWIGTFFGISVLKETPINLSVQSNYNKKGLNVYPNPAADFLRLSGEVGDNYEIYNISGQLKHKGLVKDKTINTSTLEAGIYMLVVKGENEFFSTKFIKQ